jgi:hypothetical protein
MDFYVNGEKIDVKLEDEKTIGDVLKSFEVTCEENNAAVIGISIDGKTITADIFDEESKKELSENTKFEFSIINVETIKDSFSSLANLFNELSTKMEEVPVLLQKNETKLASESITKLADSINHFCHLAALASLFPETFTNTTIDGMNFNDFFKDFSPILADFEQALQNNDTVMIGDLAEYEICPRLQKISESLKNLQK